MRIRFTRAGYAVAAGVAVTAMLGMGAASAAGASVTKAAADAPGQWLTWWWVCFGGMIFFLLSIPLMKGRWKPSDARRDEQEHEAMVEAELAKLHR